MQINGKHLGDGAIERYQNFPWIPRLIIPRHVATVLAIRPIATAIQVGGVRANGGAQFTQFADNVRIDGGQTAAAHACLEQSPAYAPPLAIIRLGGCVRTRMARIHGGRLFFAQVKVFFQIGPYLCDDTVDGGVFW